MSVSTRLLTCLTLLLSISAWSTSWAAPDGAALYDKHCAACHQSQGRGGIGLPLSAAKLANVSDRYLRITMRVGRPGRIMPAFTALSDAQVDAIIHFLRKVSGTHEMKFPLDPIVGDVAVGKQLFGEYCATCHGTDGSGEGAGTGVTLSRERSFLVMPPAINNPGFLVSASDAMIKHTVMTGREGTIMPSFKKPTLTDEQINAVVAYVRSLQGPLPTEPLDDSEPMSPTHIVESPYDFQTTLDNVRMALTGANFRLFKERFLEQGMISEFEVNKRQAGIRFCNFSKLYNLLNIEPRLGVILPCRITVIERDDGQVLLVAQNMSAIAHWFNNQELEDLADAMEEIIETVLDEATL